MKTCVDKRGVRNSLRNTAKVNHKNEGGNLVKSILAVLILLAGLAFAGTPCIGHAQQITPYPNPSAGTITVNTSGVA